MRKKLALALGLTAIAAAGAAFAAIGPGPGEIFIYRDANGIEVGRWSVNCEGVVVHEGLTKGKPEVGYYICDPKP